MVENGIIIAMFILFLHSCTWEGMIFEKIKDIIKPKGMLYKPIYGCPICMTPWWGTLIFLIFFPFTIKAWLLTVGLASGINVLSVIGLSIREYCIERVKQIETEI